MVCPPPPEEPNELPLSLSDFGSNLSYQEWGECFEDLVAQKDWKGVCSLLLHSMVRSSYDWFYHVFSLIDAQAPVEVLERALDMLDEQMQRPITQWHGILSRLVYFEKDLLDLFLEHPYGQKTQSFLDPSVLAILPSHNNPKWWHQAQPFLTPSLVKEVFVVIDHYMSTRESEHVLENWREFCQNQPVAFLEELIDELKTVSPPKTVSSAWHEKAIVESIASFERQYLVLSLPSLSTSSPSLRKL